MYQIQCFNDNVPYTKLLYTSYKPAYGAAHTLNVTGKDKYFLKRNGKMCSVSHDVFYLRVFLREVY